jgi:hypothetical protein
MRSQHIPCLVRKKHYNIGSKANYTLSKREMIMVLGIMRSKKFSKRVLMGLLVIIIPAFVFWGVGSLSDRPKPAGRIYGRAVSAEDFYSSRQGVQTQILLNYFTDYERMSSILKDRTLMNTMAWERLLLLSAARDRKIQVSNQEVMSFIASHPLFQRGGGFDRTVYASILRNPSLSLSPRQFEELIRENLLVMKFRNSLLDKIAVSEEEILERFRLFAGKTVFSYFLIDKNKYSEDVSINEQEIVEAYENNKDRLFSGEKAQVEYIEAKYSSSSEKDRIDETLRKAVVEISRDGLSLEEYADKTDFRYGKTGFFAVHNTLSGSSWFPGFNEATFELKDGEMSPPVFSDPEQGSAFMIRRMGTEMPELLSFEEVREEISEAIKNVKSVDLAKEEADKIFQAISDGEMTFDEAATSVNSPIKQTPPLSIEDHIENLIPARDAIIASFSTEDEILPPYITHVGVLIMRVDDVIDPDLSDLTQEVRDSITESIVSERQVSSVTDWLRQNSSAIVPARPLEEM